MTTSSSNIKGLPDSNNNYPIWKDVILVGDSPPKMDVLIDESINEGSSKKIESSHDGRQRGQEKSLTNGRSETS